MREAVQEGKWHNIQSLPVGTCTSESQQRLTNCRLEGMECYTITLLFLQQDFHLCLENLGDGYNLMSFSRFAASKVNIATIMGKILIMGINQIGVLELFGLRLPIPLFQF